LFAPVGSIMERQASERNVHWGKMNLSIKLRKILIGGSEINIMEEVI
jgi:hypothetical protein